MSQADGKRLILYYAYEHPWMLANDEHFSYSKAFYEQRSLFHGCVFDKA